MTPDASQVDEVSGSAGDSQNTPGEKSNRHLDISLAVLAALFWLSGFIGVWSEFRQPNYSWDIASRSNSKTSPTNPI